MRLDAVLLETPGLRLEPLSASHAEGLAVAVQEGELWKLEFTSVPAPADVAAFIDTALAQQQRGESLPFAIVRKQDNAVIGCTRYMNIQLPHKRLEIGHTFIASSWQRTAVNTEMKREMLRHAFEDLGMNRVEFLTDFRNTRSRAAIERLGAQQEGILRSHMVMRDGHVRDTVIFSITRSEWPAVKQGLSRKLESFGVTSI